MASSSTCTAATVFISHAAEDKATIAIPLREKLLSHGITAFVDEADMPRDTAAERVVMHALHNAKIAVILISPELIARKWPMRELLTILQRWEDATTSGNEPPPLIIPVFYRLKVGELFDEPRLDRTNKQGKLLYSESRFSERMKNGEPEASIAVIKSTMKTVHGITGVRNDVEASNDTSYAMSYRRNILLHRVCERIVHAASPEPGKETEHLSKPVQRDEFQAHFDIPHYTSQYVFDFTSTKKGGSPLTQEGRLLQQVLDQSGKVTSAIAIQGIAGVGKTSLLLGLSGVKTIKSHFKDGVYKISLGMDATQSSLIEELSMTVENSGGREKANGMRREDDFRKVVTCFRSWFARRRCLFMIDDVWETAEIPSSTIHQLLKLQERGQGSKTVLTTRSLGIALRAGSAFTLEPRQPLDAQARAILIRYSGIPPKRHNFFMDRAIVDILKRCCGLPFFLAVAGKAVRTLSLRKGSKLGRAYQVYASSLDAHMKSLVNTDVDSYQRLEKILSFSIGLLEQRMNNLGFYVPLTAAEMHMRLSVIEKQEKVPLSMLQHLWELKGKSETAIVAREFEQLALVNMEIFREDDGKYAEVLRLHDCLHLFAQREARRTGKEKKGHEALLNAYGTRLEAKQGCRAWWSTSLAPDGYIHQHLCRHLLKSGRSLEVVELLFNPKWTARLFAVCGIVQIERDFGLCLSMLANRPRPSIRYVSMNVTDDETDFQVDDDTTISMELVFGALKLASEAMGRNFDELMFQTYGRLKRHSASFRQVRKYLDRIEENPLRPSLRSANCFLEEPILANVRILSVGVAVWCMVSFSDRQRVACGCGDGRIIVVDLMRSTVEFEWKAHQADVASLALGRNGTRLVSGSADATAKVWSVETRACLATFEGHGGGVNCVTVMRDGIRVISVSAMGGTALVWNMDTGTLVSRLSRDETVSIRYVAPLPDGEHVVTAERDGKLRLRNVLSGAQVGSDFAADNQDYPVTCIDVTPDGKCVAMGSDDGTARMWDIGTREQIDLSFPEVPSYRRRCLIEGVAFSPLGERIVLGSGDGLVVWDTMTGKEVWSSLRFHSKRITSVSFLGDRNSFVSCSSEGDIRVWGVRGKNENRKFNNHTVWGACFTPDSKHVVIGTRDMTLRILDVESGLQLGSPMRGHSNAVRDVAVTPDGRAIVSVSDDKTVRVWNPTSRELTHTFTGHSGWIYCVAITPKGDRAITGSFDKTVRVWDLGKMDGSHDVLKGHRDSVLKVFVSDDGLRIISVEKDKVFVWEIQTLQLLTSFTWTGVWKLSRRQVLKTVAETTVLDTTELCIPLRGREIAYGEGRNKQVLASLPRQVWSWSLAPDMKTVFVGLEDWTPAFMTLNT